MKKAKTFLANKKNRDVIFCLLVIAVPMIQFAIFYVGVNINSFVLAFQKYEIDSVTGLGRYVSNGFNNFVKMIETIKTSYVFLPALKNSVVAFAIVTLVGIVFALLFSLYIYKKHPGSNVFKVLLFAPSILSAVVTVTMFRYFVESAIPGFFNLEQGFLANPKTKMGTIFFYNIWIGFGVQILMYSGAMEAIDPSILEAGKLDGTNQVTEFFKIILPLIFPTIQTFVVVGVSSIFVNQINLVAFVGLSTEPKYMTIGYFLFKEAELAKYDSAKYPMLATYGISLTLIAAPLTLLVRYLMDKFGPSTD